MNETPDPDAPNPAPPRFTSYQKFVVAVLAFLQFTIVLDFMVLSPLGAILMPVLAITPKQFGLVVSVYAIAAAVSGVLAAGFADRYDRKKFLLFFYGGFLLGTVCCGLAPTYPLLLAARVVTGLFGGVVGAASYAVAADLFPLALRGRVMGLIMSAFGASQVLGLPIGIYLATHLGWHAPFLMIAGVCTVVGMAILIYRRRTVGAVFSATTRMDKTMYVFLGSVIVLGLVNTLVANVFGEYDYRESVSVWFRGIFRFSLKPELMAAAPIGFKLHALVAFSLLALWPFTRLVHVFSAPLGYVTRPYIVYRSRDDQLGSRAPRRGWEKIK